MDSLQVLFPHPSVGKATLFVLSEEDNEFGMFVSKAIAEYPALPSTCVGVL